MSTISWPKMFQKFFFRPQVTDRWWQLTDFFEIFTPKIWGGSWFPILTVAYFSKGLVQPPTRWGTQTTPFLASSFEFFVVRDGSLEPWDWKNLGTSHGKNVPTSNANKSRNPFIEYMWECSSTLYIIASLKLRYITWKNEAQQKNCCNEFAVPSRFPTTWQVKPWFFLAEGEKILNLAPMP